MNSRTLTWQARAAEIATQGISAQEAALIDYFRSCCAEVQSIVIASLAAASPLVGAKVAQAQA